MRKAIVLAGHLVLGAHRGQQGQASAVRSRESAAVVIVALLTFVAAGSPNGAHAELGPPPLALGQDVTVTYVTEQTGTPQALRRMLPDGGRVRSRVLRQAGTGMARFEGEQGYVTVYDTRGRKSWTFTTSASSPGPVTLSEGDEVGLLPEETGRDPDYLARPGGGASEVGGLACNNWRVILRDDPNDPGMLVCYAADGLALRTTRSEANQTTTQVAERVEYGKLDPALFAPPAGRPIQRAKGP